MGVCFEVLRLHRLVAACFTDFEPPVRLMKWIGTRREVHRILAGDAVRESLYQSGTWLEIYGYAMLRGVGKYLRSETVAPRSSEPDPASRASPTIGGRSSRLNGRRPLQ